MSSRSEATPFALATEEKFFHVAPVGALTAGRTPALSRPEVSPEMAETLDLLYPGGVTNWGDAMLNSARGAMVLGPSVFVNLDLATFNDAGRLMLTEQGVETMRATSNRVIELVFELVRRLEFSEKPSRMSSVFTYRTVEDALAYRALRRDPLTHEIWRLSCDRPDAIHAGDSRWLVPQYDVLRSIYVARHYWLGEPISFESPLPADDEILIPADAVTFTAVEVAAAES